MSKKFYSLSVQYGFANEDSVFGFMGCTTEGIDDEDSGPVDDATLVDADWFRTYMRTAMANEPYLDRVPFDELLIVENRTHDQSGGLSVRFELTHPRDLPTASDEGPTVAFDFSFSYDPEDPWTEQDFLAAKARKAAADARFNRVL